MTRGKPQDIKHDEPLNPLSRAAFKLQLRLHILPIRQTRRNRRRACCGCPCTGALCRLEWTERCDRSKLGIWETYPPGEISRESFLAKCREAEARGVRFSVGVVGMQEHIAEIKAMRNELPAHIYLWVNAYKRVHDYYSAADLRTLEAIDSLFPINNQHHASKGRVCHIGERVITVDGNGVIRRCHFIKAPIGNIYQLGLEKALYTRPCSTETCGCHIGYVHLESLQLDAVFGNGILERIPARMP